MPFLVVCGFLGDFNRGVILVRLYLVTIVLISVLGLMALILSLIGAILSGTIGLSNCSLVPLVERNVSILHKKCLCCRVN